MSSYSRRFRRIGAIVLLFAWAQVATANAVPCAIWCHLNGGAASHAAQMIEAGHDHGAAAGHHDCDINISATHCSAPQLLVVAAVTPDVPAIPAITVTAGDPPIASPISIVIAYIGSKTPPPRA